METRETARFAVVISRETLEDWTIFVTADSREDACEQADAIVSTCMFPEFEMIESDYHFDANPIDAWHHAEPTRADHWWRDGLPPLPQQGAMDRHGRGRPKEPNRQHHLGSLDPLTILEVPLIEAGHPRLGLASRQSGA